MDAVWLQGGAWGTEDFVPRYYSVYAYHRAIYARSSVAGIWVPTDHIHSALVVHLPGTKRPRLMNTYIVNHYAMDSQWNLPTYGFDSAYYGHQEQSPHQTVSIYLEWFIERSHSRVHPIDDNVRDEVVLEPSAYPILNELYIWFIFSYQLIS